MQIHLAPIATIDPAAVYAETTVALALDIPLAAMREARRRGELQFVRRGRRVLLSGRDLLAWLTPADRREVPRA